MDQKYRRIIYRYKGTAPVQIKALAEELGINVWRSNSLGNDISGKLFRDKLNGGPSGYSILVNGRDPLVRQRFTMAHEIGHYILHLDQVGAELIDDSFYRSRLTDKFEREANKFAAGLLMPENLIEKYKSFGVTDPEELARKFNVSNVAMKIELGLPT